MYILLCVYIYMICIYLLMLRTVSIHIICSIHCLMFIYFLNRSSISSVVAEGKPIPLKHPSPASWWLNSSSPQQTQFAIFGVDLGLSIHGDTPKLVVSLFIMAVWIWCDAPGTHKTRHSWDAWAVPLPFSQTAIEPVDRVMTSVSMAQNRETTVWPLKFWLGRSCLEPLFTGEAVWSQEWPRTKW